MNSSPKRGRQGQQQEQVSPFADLPAYPAHEEPPAPITHAAIARISPFAPVARYEFTQTGITDDSGNLRFTVGRGGGLCDPSGYELASLSYDSFPRRVDVIVHGAIAASVRHAHPGPGKHWVINTPAGRLTASGHLLGDRYTITGPDGDEIASVTQQPGCEVEIEPGQDHVFVLGIVLAIDNFPSTGGAGQGAAGR
jgi:hypothetical protein